MSRTSSFNTIANIVLAATPVLALMVAYVAPIVR